MGGAWAWDVVAAGGAEAVEVGEGGVVVGEEVDGASELQAQAHLGKGKGEAGGPSTDGKFCSGSGGDTWQRRQHLAATCGRDVQRLLKVTISYPRGDDPTPAASTSAIRRDEMAGAGCVHCCSGWHAQVPASVGRTTTLRAGAHPRKAPVASIRPAMPAPAPG